MKFATTLLAVRDMDKALLFYKELFGQEVAVDLGWNKALTCGLALQEHFEKYAEFPRDSMHYRHHTVELYFETEDFDGFLALLERHPEVETLHGLREMSWLQRTIHIYDPDGHLIEVGESMYSVARKQFEQGKTVEEAAKLLEHPLDVVQAWHKEYLAQKAGN